MPGRDLIGGADGGESPLVQDLSVPKTRSRQKPAKRVNLIPPSDPHERAPKTKGPSIYKSRLEGGSRGPHSPSTTEATPASDAPLTPPLQYKSEFKSWINDDVLRNQDFAGKDMAPRADAYNKHRSPPTPDPTPPRQPPQNQSQVSVQSSHNHSSSLSGSFITALENQSLENDIWSAQAAPGPAIKTDGREVDREHARRVGLGLGLDLEEEEAPTPREKSPELIPHARVVKMEDHWGGHTPDQISARLYSSQEEDLPTPLVDFREPFEPSLRYQKKPQVDSNGAFSASEPKGQWQKDLEEFSVQSDKVSEGSLAEINAEIKEVNERRQSQVSTGSTVVTVRILDSTPKRSRTLRHTGKFINSKESAMDADLQRSDRRKHRSLKRATSKTSGEDLRKSYMTEKAQREEPKLVVVDDKPSAIVIIPDRRPSVQSSRASSRPISKTFSTASKPLSSRPTTAPDESPGYFETPTRDKRRTVSVVLQQARPVKTEKAAEIASVASPTKANSPPSAAATSPSTALSVTSAGIRRHSLPLTPQAQNHSSPTTASNKDARSSWLESPDAEWTMLPPLSPMVTPFSIRSVGSSTPGTLEVKEATALSIHPHTNKSILVIQEVASTGSSKSTEQTAIIAENASIAIPGTLSPVITTAEPAPLDRALEDPRGAPLAPNLIQIIPPTPANASGSEIRLRKRVPRSNTINGPLDTLRRAVSASRHSDGSRRTFSFRGGGQSRQTQEGEAVEEEGATRLHPSWLPRRHRDDDGEEDSDAAYVAANRRKETQAPRRSQSLTRRISGAVRNATRSASLRRLGPRRASSVSAADLQPRRSTTLPFEIPASSPLPAWNAVAWSDRFSRSLRLSSSRSSRPQRYSTAAWSNQPHYEFVHPNERERQDTATTRMRKKMKLSEEAAEQRGYHAQALPGVKGLKERLDRRREEKDEGRREARREWMRGNIGLVGPVDDNAQRSRERLVFRRGETLNMRS